MKWQLALFLGLALSLAVFAAASPSEPEPQPDMAGDKADTPDEDLAELAGLSNLEEPSETAQETLADGALEDPEKKFIRLRRIRFRLRRIRFRRIRFRRIRRILRKACRLCRYFG